MANNPCTHSSTFRWRNDSAIMCNTCNAGTYVSELNAVDWPADWSDGRRLDAILRLRAAIQRTAPAQRLLCAAPPSLAPGNATLAIGVYVKDGERRWIIEDDAAIPGLHCFDQDLGDRLVEHVLVALGMPAESIARTLVAAA